EGGSKRPMVGTERARPARRSAQAHRLRIVQARLRLQRQENAVLAVPAALVAGGAAGHRPGDSESTNPPASAGCRADPTATLRGVRLRPPRHARPLPRVRYNPRAMKRLAGIVLKALTVARPPFPAAADARQGTPRRQQPRP